MLGVSSNIGAARCATIAFKDVASRPAKVGDRLTTRDFGTGTRGFAASEDVGVVVCVLPGTELAFKNPIEFGLNFTLVREDARLPNGDFPPDQQRAFAVHHDALEFPDGRFALLSA